MPLNKYRVDISNLKGIPGMPLAYWVTEKSLNAYTKLEKVEKRAVKGLDTNGNIDSFLRLWHEVANTSFSANDTGSNWRPLAKGGKFRRWGGNADFIIDYKNNGSRLRKNKANLRSEDRYGKDGATWSVVSTDGFAVRRLPKNALFDQAGSAIHCNLEIPLHWMK